MKNNYWEKEVYYKVIDESHSNENIVNDKIFNEELKYLSKGIKKNVLDFGCGEGWFIREIQRRFSDNLYYGIDVSEVGIELASKKIMPHVEFKVFDGKKIPYPDNFFDLTFSNFVFEHLENPLIIFNEISRVTKKNGLIFIGCPNYGSPLFKSPCNSNNKLLLMLLRFFAELLPYYFFKKSFNWNRVQPIELPQNVHIPDYDTLCEPNLSSFEKYLRNYRDLYKVIEISSLWNKFDYNNEVKNVGIVKKILVNIAKFLGLKNLFRFQLFGSLFFAVVQKK